MADSEVRQKFEDPCTAQLKLPEITTRFGPGNCYGESDEVLAYSGHICTAVKHASGAWATIEGSNLAGVTHWQPLPAPPESK